MKEYYTKRISALDTELKIIEAKINELRNKQTYMRGRLDEAEEALKEMDKAE